MLPLKKVFLITLLIPLTYYGVWFLFNHYQLPWHGVLNFPAHAFLAASLPWSLPFVANLFGLEGALLQILRMLFVSIGFAVNITMLVFMLRKIAKDKRIKKLKKAVTR